RECPSEVSHHIEGYREDVLPSRNLRGVGCEYVSYRAAGYAQGPYLERLSPEHLRRDGLRRQLEAFQGNGVAVGRSQRLTSSGRVHRSSPSYETRITGVAARRTARLSSRVPASASASARPVPRR